MQQGVARAAALRVAWVARSSLTFASQRHGGAARLGQRRVASARADAQPPVPADTGAVNKRPTELSERTYAYLLSNTREHEALRRCREETAGVHGAHMQIPPEQGALLALLLEVTGASRVLELGTFTGYSSLAMALALPPHGRVVTCDKDAATLAVARRHWAAAGVENKVEALAGPALESLDALLARGEESTFDFAFIDADKRAYGDYYERCLRLVRPGGLIGVDNTLFHGRLADPAVTDKQTLALREFNARVLADARVTHALVPIGDGLTLLRRRS